jgi:rfaE bifunctional protein nucleotidyltransferase chain/domain
MTVWIEDGINRSNTNAQGSFSAARSTIPIELRFESTPFCRLPFCIGTVKIGSVLNCRQKIKSLEDLPAWRAGVRASGRILVATNGCFDLLHAGHVSYLEAARNQGDLLVVGLNSDASVRSLKGPSRPLNAQNDRAFVLAALECVDAVCIFPDSRATVFLNACQPDVYVKGGDYTIDTLNSEERNAVEGAGGRIEILPLVPGKSTTSIIEKMGGRS